MQIEEFATEPEAIDRDVMEPMRDKVRLNIWVRRSLWDGVLDIAKEEGISQSDVVRSALKRHIRNFKSRSDFGKGKEGDSNGQY